MMTLWPFSKQLPRRLGRHVQWDKNNALPLAASMVVLSYLGWVMATWSQSIAIDSQPQNPLAVDTANAEQATALTDYLQIADWQLLGEGAAMAEINPADTSVPATPLQLKLLGTFYLSNQPRNSYAVIQSADGSQKTYRLGEPLQEGVSLQAVEKNRVVLLHDQHQEYLAFDPNTLALLTPKY